MEALLTNKGNKEDHELHLQELDAKIKELPLKERVKVIAINHHYKIKQDLDEELDQKIHDINREFDIKSLPIYTEQKQIILGERGPSEEELAKLKDFFNEDELKEAQQFLNNNESISNYWSTVLTNCEALSHIWGEKDKEILKHLISVELETSADTDNFTLRFVFSDNEFFKNKELTKRFNIEKGEDFPKSTVGTVIDWNEEKDITFKMVEKKQKNKKTGATRVIKKKQPVLSFFNFFKNSEDDAEEHVHHHDHDHDHKKNDEDNDIDKDYEIGKTIAEECIPFSLEYYLGINPEDEDYEDVDDEDDDGDDDGDSEKDKDTDEDEDKKKNRKKSTDSKKSNKGKKDKDAKPECKQQ